MKSTLTQPTDQILKENEYKLVLLHTDQTGAHTVSKTFRGHAPENCRRNAEHTFASLQLLKESFSDVVQSPSPLVLSDHSVSMEYLADLPAAKQLGFATLAQAEGFFRRCYELQQDLSQLGSIADSVHLTPRTRALLEADFPLALGFKGDLFENLRLGADKPIIADSETASQEPRGLSELILYAFLAAAEVKFPVIKVRLPAAPRPVVFDYLTSTQAQALIDAALEFASEGMRSVPYPIRVLKLKQAQRLLNRLLAQ